MNQHVKANIMTSKGTSMPDKASRRVTEYGTSNATYAALPDNKIVNISTVKDEETQYKSSTHRQDT